MREAFPMYALVMAYGRKCYDVNEMAFRQIFIVMIMIFKLFILYFMYIIIKQKECAIIFLRNRRNQAIWGFKFTKY